MERLFIKVKDIEFHVRIRGKGFPLVLLHASPSSSASFAGVAQVLEQHFTLIMPDTPGYGLSDAIPDQVKELREYMPYFHGLFQVLGLEKFAIYGTATGAQLAIRYGLTYPTEVEHLFLDNAAHFEEELYQEIKKAYFPDLKPGYDGEHLTRTWTIVRDMFRYFPWFSRKKQDRLPARKLSPAIYHMIAMEFLQAGAGYDRAYAAAFLHERVHNVAELGVPASIFKHLGSIMIPHIDRLVQHPQLPARVKVVETPASPAERNASMLAYMKNQLPEMDLDLQIRRENVPAASQFFIKINKTFLHGWHKSDGQGQPLLILPNSGESAAIWKDQLDEIRQGRPGVLLSLPGQGDSDVWDGEFTKEIRADMLRQLMEQLGYTHFEVFQPEPAFAPIEITPPDAYGLYMLKAWIALRELAGDEPDLDRLQLLLREKLKNRN